MNSIFLAGLVQHVVDSINQTRESQNLTACKKTLVHHTNPWKIWLNTNTCALPRFWGGVIAVYLDFKRAFETIDCDIHFKKLYYGVRIKELSWFCNYLNGRKWKTAYGNITSDERVVQLGDPQGLVLGPLLFILYINDIAECLKYAHINLFADKTLLYITTTNGAVT